MVPCACLGTNNGVILSICFLGAKAGYLLIRVSLCGQPPMSPWALSHVHPGRHATCCLEALSVSSVTAQGALGCWHLTPGPAPHLFPFLVLLRILSS